MYGEVNSVQVFPVICNFILMCITNLDEFQLIATFFNENYMWDDQERQGKEVKEYYVGGRGGM